ncbi:hypothetical protein MEG05_15800 [Vibrio aestuarianus]|uniref:hypothetical protein n=1 Tax=Vibrio aestuarianus TaxID=28171 RepID=UPI00237CE0BF|nr:hypothetical protein [Vibrio aestuarianus]MDE1315522.1 hypothetical protein [Vibrio aestuarianus]
MSDLRGVLLTFVFIGVVGVVGVRLMEVNSINDKPLLGGDQYHVDFIKHYDKNTLTIKQIEECLNIKYHLDHAKMQAVELQSQIENLSAENSIQAYNEQVKQHRAQIENLNSITRHYNAQCANKRYYLDDYNYSQWQKTLKM